MTPRRFDAVIFDMDGTLVDSEPVQEALTRTMLAPYGIAWEEDGEFLGCTDLDMFTALVARLAVASSSARPIIEAVVDALGARPLFGALVSGLDVPRGKPAPDIFLETARQLGVAPGRCLVIEDSRNGLLAAKAAGMACAVVPCAASRHQSFLETDWLLSSLTDLETAAGL